MSGDIVNCIKMIWFKIKHPKSGYWERVCYLNGYTKSDVDNWEVAAYIDEFIDEINPVNRERICHYEMSFWE